MQVEPLGQVDLCFAATLMDESKALWMLKKFSEADVFNTLM